jgi:hypothetical protein
LPKYLPEVQLKDVALYEAQAGFGETPSQECRQVPVDFDGYKAIEGGSQGGCERPAARSNFHGQIAFLWPHHADNLPCYRPVDQEMLTKTPARPGESDGEFSIFQFWLENQRFFPRNSSRDLLFN